MVSKYPHGKKAVGKAAESFAVDKVSPSSANLAQKHTGKNSISQLEKVYAALSGKYYAAEYAGEHTAVNSKPAFAQSEYFKEVILIHIPRKYNKIKACPYY